MNYETIKPYYELLKDQPLDFIYYGEPKDEYYITYDAEDEHGNHLVLSYECNELCEELAYLCKEIDPDILSENEVTEEQLEYFCTKATEAEVQKIVLSLVDSLAYNDLFITCLKNGYLVRLIEYLLTFSDSLE